MCGICGFWPRGNVSHERSRAIAEAMADTLSRRGSDDSGIWVDPTPEVALAPDRLSFLDLSDTARQPVLSDSARFVLSYDGESYNFIELRDKQKGHNCSFRGRPDTEVLITGSSEWGVNEAVGDPAVLLRQAGKDRMAADVSPGALLCGGYDSSSVVAHMQAESESSIKSVSIGFDESRYDEAPVAAK